MATTTPVIGFDGMVSVGSIDVFKVKSFSATLSRVQSDVTAFGDTGRRRRLGLSDLTGSLTGVPWVGTTTVTTGTALFYGGTATQTLTLKLYDGSTDAQIVATCVFENQAFASAVDGDASVAIPFANADGAAPVVTWLT